MEQYKPKQGIERLKNEGHADWRSTMPQRRAPGLEFEHAKLRLCAAGANRRDCQREAVS